MISIIRGRFFARFQEISRLLEKRLPRPQGEVMQVAVDLVAECVKHFEDEPAGMLRLGEA
ncbi:MAG: hypothetical protein SFV81_11990 [Pirellulaceae bacterium]|nr:hypothetical protein [Pirellulaceae bacterium]